MTKGATRLDPLSEERIARNDARFRRANEEIEAAAIDAGADIRLIPFICECADRACSKIVRLSVEEYERVRANPRRFLNAPGHEPARPGTSAVVDRRERFDVVEKLGRAGEVAERLDERAGKREEPTAGG